MPSELKGICLKKNHDSSQERSERLRKHAVPVGVKYFMFPTAKGEKRILHRDQRQTTKWSLLRVVQKQHLWEAHQFLLTDISHNKYISNSLSTAGTNWRERSGLFFFFPPSFHFFFYEPQENKTSAKIRRHVVPVSFS